MGDFISDGQPYETPLDAANQGYAATSPDLTTAFGAAKSAIGGLGDTLLKRGARNVSENVGGILGAAQRDNLLSPSVGGGASYQTMSAADINAAAGRHVTDEDQPANVGNQLIKWAQDKANSEEIWSRYANDHNGVGNFFVNTAAWLSDPGNLSSVFVPGLGEEAALSGLTRAGMAAGGAATRVAARGIAGATAAAAGQVPLAVLRAGLAPSVADDYSMRDGLRDILFAAVPGAILHAGFGALGDLFKERKIAPAVDGAPATVEPPQPAHMPPEAAAILASDATTKDAAMRTAVSQVVQGAPVAVDHFFYRPPAASTAIERATEEPAAGVHIQAADTVGEQARQMAPEVFSKYDPLAERYAELGKQLDNPDKAFGDAIDAKATELEQQAVAEQNSKAAKKLTDEAISLRNGREAAIKSAAADARVERVDLDRQMQDLAPHVTAALEQAKTVRAAKAASEMVKMGPKTPPPDLSAIAEAQARLARDGYAPGLTSDQLMRAEATSVGPESVLPEGEKVGARVPNEGTKAEPGKSAPAAIDPDPEMVAAEEAARADEHALPEEKAELDAADHEIEMAKVMDKAYNLLSACIAHHGV